MAKIGQNNVVVNTGDNTPKVVRFPENQHIVFKLIGDPRHGYTSHHVVFTHFFEYKIDGARKYVFRSNTGQGDVVSRVKNSIKKSLLNSKKLYENNQEFSFYKEQTTKIIDFLTASGCNLALAVFPEDPEIKILEIKNTAMERLLEENAKLQSRNLDVFKLVSDNGNPQPVAGWMKGIKIKGQTFRDTKYVCEILQEYDAETRQTYDALRSVHPSIFDIDDETAEGLARIPDIGEHIGLGRWNPKEDEAFASVFNWPSFEEVSQTKQWPIADDFIARSFNAVPENRKPKTSTDDSQSNAYAPQPVAQQPVQQAPQQQYQQPVQQAPQQQYQQPVQQAPQQQYQQPVQQAPQQQYQQPVQQAPQQQYQQPVPQTHAQQPAQPQQYNVNLNAQPTPVSQSEIDDLLNTPI
jgi:hypothetical protein